MQYRVAYLETAFDNTARPYHAPRGLAVIPGKYYLVDTKFGEDISLATSGVQLVHKDSLFEVRPPLGKHLVVEGDDTSIKKLRIIRPATEEEIEDWQALREEEKTALQFAKQEINDLRLKMKLINVHFLYKKRMIIFLFTSGERIDFRDFVKKLVMRFETRIELRQISSAYAEQVFENSNDNQKLVPLIVDCNEEIKKYFARHPDKLYDLTSRKFEELIANILKDLGFDVELTKATRDGGSDIYAYIRNEIGTFLTFVECKKWAPTHHVGIEVVQRLFGVQQSKKANKSMIVTTSFFTKPAIDECKMYDNLMSLNDYNNLKVWLERYR